MKLFKKKKINVGSKHSSGTFKLHEALLESHGSLDSQLPKICKISSRGMKDFAIHTLNTTLNHMYEY